MSRARNRSTAIDRLLSESPQSISVVSFGMDDPVARAERVSALSKRGGKKVGKFKGLDVIKSGSYIHASDSNGLVFFVRVIEAKFRAFPTRHASQIAVWRRSPAPAGIAAHVFWTHVFPVHETVVSDVQQTEAAMRFWGDRIGEALQQGLYVYAVNLDGRGSIDEVKDVKTYLVMRGKLYGHEARFRHLRLAISAHPLSGQS